MLGAAVVLAVCMKSLELKYKGKRSYVFLRRDVAFRTLRRGHDHQIHFVMPVTFLFASWIMLESAKDSLVNTWRMKYFLAPHMRFEVNTGRRLELYQDPLAEQTEVNPVLSRIYALKRYINNYGKEELSYNGKIGIMSLQESKKL